MNPTILASLNDQAALLIGRLIMSWGLFDQRLYSQIIFFECQKYIRKPTGDPPARKDIVDYRFEVRVKRLRKLSQELCYADPKIMSRVDDVLRRLKELSLIRHHVAHGYSRVVAEAPGRKADRCHVRLQMKLNINRATESNVSRTLGRVEREAVAHALALGALAC